MKTACPSCGMAYPVNPEFVGCTVSCPHCGHERILHNGDIIRSVPRQAVEPMKQSSFDGLGFVLGLLLNVPGVFIAALINGRRGAISSLWGLLIDGIVVVIGYGLMLSGL